MITALLLDPRIREFRQVGYFETAMFGGDNRTVTDLVHVSIMDRYVAWLIEEHQPTEDFPYRIESIWVQKPTNIMDHSTWVEGGTTFEWGEKTFVFQRTKLEVTETPEA